MTQPLNLTRRRFLQITTPLVLAAGSLPEAGATAPAAATRWGVGCRDVHLKAVHPTDSWAALRQLGADCFEAELDDALALTSLVAPGRRYTVANPEGIAALRADLRANQCRISAFCMHNRFDERLEQEIETARKLVRAAEQLDVPVIRIDVVPRALEPAAFEPFAIKACQQLCRATDGAKVRFGIENHGRATNEPDLLARLLEGVGSDRLGLTLDTANFYWFGHPLEEVYRIYERFASRVFHTHCKNIAYPADKRNVRRPMGWDYARCCCPVDEGDIDFRRVVGILRKAGYRGDLCVEDESLGRFPEAERAGHLKRQVAFLRGLPDAAPGRAAITDQKK